MKYTPLESITRLSVTLSFMAACFMAGSAMAGDQRNQATSPDESLTIKQAVETLNALVDAHEADDQQQLVTVKSSSPLATPSAFVKAMIAVSDDPYDVDLSNKIDLGDGITLVTVAGEMSVTNNKSSTFQLNIVRAIEEAEGISETEQQLIKSVTADIGAAPVRNLALLPEQPLTIDRVEIGASPVQPLQQIKTQPDGIFPPLDF